MAVSESNNSDPHQATRRRSLFDPIGRIVDSVVPTVAKAVDVDDLIARIDVDDVVARIDIEALLDRIDLEQLMSRIDVDEILARVDVNGMLDRIDVDRLLGRVSVEVLMSRIDVDALLSRVDVDQLMARIDLGALLARVDVNEILARIDVDQVIGRVDLDEVMARIDVDAVVNRIDIDRIVQSADLAGIVAQSTRGITASTIDLVRRQVAGIDEVITRIAARVARRDPDLDPDGPPGLQRVPTADRPARERPSISGHFAGPLARLAAWSLDGFAMVFLFGVATAIGSWLIDLLTRGDRAGIGGPWAVLFFVGWALLYFAVPLALTGRTLGKAVVGLRVVKRNGGPIEFRHALVRVIVLPFSIALLGLGLIGGVFGRQRRTLHDVVAGTVEVIDWGDRPAALPSPISNWLEQRQSQAVMTSGVQGDSVGNRADSTN